MTIQGSQRIHNKAFAVVLGGVLPFFDRTATGRILNRFSKDCDVLDDSLPDIFFQCLQYLSVILSIWILIAIQFPYFLVALVPVIIFFITLSVYYNRTAREVKRLYLISSSPVNSLLNSSLAGLNTIRAYNSENFFLSRMLKLVDRNLSVFFLFLSIQRWFAFRLDLISNIIILATSLLGVILKGTITPAVFGLTLSCKNEEKSICIFLFIFFQQQILYKIWEFSNGPLDVLWIQPPK
jgi:ABC-type multidrug transport system fused ATPase/permease subunit